MDKGLAETTLIAAGIRPGGAMEHGAHTVE